MATYTNNSIPNENESPLSFKYGLIYCIAAFALAVAIYIGGI